MAAGPHPRAVHRDGRRRDARARSGDAGALGPAARPPAVRPGRLWAARAARGSLVDPAHRLARRAHPAAVRRRDRRLRRTGRLVGVASRHARHRDRDGLGPGGGSPRLRTAPRPVRHHVVGLGEPGVGRPRRRVQRRRAGRGGRGDGGGQPTVAGTPALRSRPLRGARVPLRRPAVGPRAPPRRGVRSRAGSLPRGAASAAAQTPHEPARVARGRIGALPRRRPHPPRALVPAGRRAARGVHSRHHGVDRARWRGDLASACQRPAQGPTPRVGVGRGPHVRGARPRGRRGRDRRARSRPRRRRARGREHGAGAPRRPAPLDRAARRPRRRAQGLPRPVTPAGPVGGRLARLPGRGHRAPHRDRRHVAVLDGHVGGEQLVLRARRPPPPVGLRRLPTAPGRRRRARGSGGSGRRDAQATR